MCIDRADSHAHIPGCKCERIGMAAGGESEVAARRESSGGAETSLTDHEDLEGYLSPAEDTFSIFSDEQPGPRPYAQVSPFLPRYSGAGFQ